VREYVLSLSTGIYVHTHLMSVYLCVCERESECERVCALFVDLYIRTYAFDECVFVCVRERESECERVCALFLDWYLHTYAFDECVFVCVRERE